MPHAIPLRLPRELARALEALAAATDRPKSYHVRRALELYLIEHMDCLLALDRLRDSGEAAVSGAKIRISLNH